MLKILHCRSTNPKTHTHTLVLVSVHTLTHSNRHSCQTSLGYCIFVLIIWLLQTQKHFLFLSDVILKI